MRRRSFSLFELAHLPKQVKIMSFLMFVYFLGWGISMPFLPIYMKEILGSYTKVGLITGLLYFLGIIWNIVLGSISDKVSRKKMIALTLFLYLPMGPIILMLKNFFDFVLYQLYHSFTASSIWISSESFVRAHSPKRKTSESMGLFDMSWITSVVIGAALSGFLFLKFGFLIFLSISFFAGLALLISTTIKDKKGKGLLSSTKEVIVREKVVKGGVFEFLKNRELLKLSIFSFFLLFSFGCLDMLIPLFSKSLHATPVETGLLFALFFLPRVSEGYFSILADKYGKKQILIKGLVACFVFFTLLFLFNGLLFLFIFTFLLSLFGISVVLPPIMGRTTELIPKKKMGKMVGVVKSFSALSTGLSPIVAGIIGDVFGLRYVFLLGSVITLCLIFWSVKLKI